MYPVAFTTEALAEASEQAAYLEDARTGYGNKFLDALKVVREKISQRPDSYASPLQRPDLHRISMPKPFNKSHSVYYSFDGKKVLIECIFPNKRDPRIWQER
ncbi:MAG: hypothetical protein AAF696_07605 [Bacteroidota bacterium]